MLNDYEGAPVFNYSKPDSGQCDLTCKARLLEVRCIGLRVTYISILLVDSPSSIKPISRC